MHIHEVGRDEFDTAGFTGVAHELLILTQACNAHDGVDTLNEQTRLELKRRGLQETRLWVAREDAGPRGFALLHGDDLDIAVHPDARRHAVGRALAVVALAETQIVEAWSHADHPAAAKLAADFAVPRVRELVVMSRTATAPLTSVQTPAGITLREFQSGDEAQLVRVNSAAFVHHAEQGNLTLADFHDRSNEPWFDPLGLFVAIDADGSVVGFHWTKVHHDANAAYGEVYVVAVAPSAAGRGIGAALTHAGLDYLGRAGVDEVILYVERDNAPALAVYRRQGFAEQRVEAQYRGTPRLR